MGNQSIAGVLRAFGATSAEVQRLFRKHCEAGHAQNMIEALAEYLVADGIAKGLIPANAGLKTPDLLSRAEAAMYDSARSYHTAGGFLVAKGFVSIQGLVAEMAKQWLKGFSAPLARTVSLKKDLSDPEVQDRLTVVALRLKEIIEKSSDSFEAGIWKNGEVRFSADAFEDICRRSAVAMFLAFENPNETNHALIHGEPNE